MGTPTPGRSRPPRLAIGLDLHQKQTGVATLDLDTGEVRQSKPAAEQVAEYLQGLGDDGKRVVMATGGLSPFAARKLRDLIPAMLHDGTDCGRRRLAA